VLPAHDKEQRPLPIKHEREPFLPLTLAMLAAPLLWVAHFAIVYLLEGFLCTRAELPSAAIPGTVVVATVVFGGACGGLMLAGDSWLRRAGVSELQSRHFLIETQRVLAGLSLLAIVWSGTGVMFLGPCSSTY
jgi:hypothetical protein